MVRTGCDRGGDPGPRVASRGSGSGRLSQGAGTMVPMEATSLRFAAAARLLGRVARRRGLDVPGFRSPPRLEGADRSLRRYASGSVTVSVRYRGRPWPAVLADMIDGVVAANRLVGGSADRTRTALWSAIEADAALAPGSRSPVVVSAPAPGGAGSSPRVGLQRYPARLPVTPAAPDAPRRAAQGGRAPLRAVPTRHVA
jgi:hypothetical protein